MKFSSLLLQKLLILITWLTYVHVQVVSGKETVVFVHGFAGFGPDELGPIQYWRHKNQYPSAFFDVFEASVGPVSSNWDRACELYAQIKGTRVDYGAAHSREHDHDRFGKDFTGKGFLPNWSTSNRIHFVAHSMGGTTVRMLEALLQEGDREEQRSGVSNISPLFTKQGNMIKSITAFSSPFDGTHLIDRLDTFGLKNLIETLVLGFASVSQLTFARGIYDFDLDHFGLERRSGENLLDYYGRIKESSIFDSSNKDISTFDLSPAGTEINNKMGEQTYPETHYFAYPTALTFDSRSSQCGTVARAKFAMLALIAPFANLMGSCGTPSIYRRNDGIVPTFSSRCPKAGYSNPECLRFDGNWRSWQPGVWYFDEKEFDHTQIIGFTLGFSKTRQVRNIYGHHSNHLLGISGLEQFIRVIDDVEPGDSQEEGDDLAIFITVCIVLLLATIILGVVIKLRRQNNNTNLRQVHRRDIRNDTGRMFKRPKTPFTSHKTPFKSSRQYSSATNSSNGVSNPVYIPESNKEMMQQGAYKWV